MIRPKTCAQTLLAVCLAACAPAAMALAETAPTARVSPAGPALLTITGADGTSASFDAAMLAALPQVSFTTTTIWTDGPQTFTGVPMGALLAAAQISGKKLIAKAANDYSVEIPVEPWPKDAPIVAYLRNGKPTSIRDKGPLWIVYPYDSDPAYRSEVIYTRSIWQLERIAVQP
mgnify:CR=1 FL=1